MPQTSSKPLAIKAEVLLDEDLLPQEEPPQHAPGVEDDTPENAEPINFSVEELFIDMPEQRTGPAHRGISSQEPDNAKKLAGKQAGCAKQDHTRIQTRAQDLGEVQDSGEGRVKSVRHVRIQDVREALGASTPPWGPVLLKLFFLA